MDIEIHITVHVYTGEKLYDELLIPHSRNYGIIGKRIVAPLRKINGRQYLIKNVEETYDVAELWNWLDNLIYGKDANLYCTENFLKKYLVFDNLRYDVNDTSKPLLFYVNRMEGLEKGVINVQLLISADARDFVIDDGIRYYFHANESSKHNEPHVHVEIRHESYGSFSLIDGRQLTNNKIRKRDIKKINDMISNRKEELLKYWNEYTDGLSVDVNQALGIINY
jgi:hypothetical protein